MKGMVVVAMAIVVVAMAMVAEMDPVAQRPYHYHPLLIK